MSRSDKARAENRRVRNERAAQNRRAQYGEPRRKFPSQFLRAERDSEAARDRSRHLDNLLRIKLGLPPIEPKKPLHQQPAPNVRIGRTNPRPGYLAIHGKGTGK